MHAPTPSSILVVDDEPGILALIKDILEDEGYEVDVAEDAEAARAARRNRRPDLILLDIWMPDSDGISLLREWSESGPGDAPVIMMSGHGTIETAVEATRLGAYDFLEKPLSTAKLLLAVRRALETAELRRENIGLKHEALQVSEPIGRSTAMSSLRDQVRRIAEHDTPVLITGESGCGKELIARYLHAHSPRATGPFVRVRIAGLIGAAGLTELLGAEDGSLIRYGAVEKANGGTLFLEDIVDMEPELQSRLVTMLQERSFLRVDGATPVPLNVRIVTASRSDVGRTVAASKLREDLYYLLNVVPLEVPPLRNHREDIPELVSYYIDVLVTREHLPNRRLTVGAQNRLRNHNWPGNVRELINVLQRLLILGSGSVIELEEVDAALGAIPEIERRDDEIMEFELPFREAREQFERAYLEYRLRKAGGSVSKVATAAGIERTHLYRKLRGLGIDPKLSSGSGN
ncbi:MAG: sigma-54 dependent transcriptional regulator [Gammaproteobacteria bacterium]|nr:sigma-54 dependent transcriptional regulator [Gammaproteobacteria bacterium]